MEDIRPKRNEIKKKISWLKFKLFLKKNRWYVILGLILGIIIIFPSMSGTAIGNWITNFLGQHNQKHQIIMKCRKYTPENLTKLEPNDIFVFGSNAKGIHGKGGAYQAKKHFGAIQGQSEGLQGQSYAVITKKDWRVEKSSTLDEITDGLKTMLEFAGQNKDKIFYVTKLGSSLAGYTVEEIKSCFEKYKDIITDNIILPKEYEVREEEIIDVVKKEESKKDFYINNIKVLEWLDNVPKLQLIKFRDRTEYKKNRVFHRLTGPAVDFKVSGNNRYFINGVEYNYKEWLPISTRIQRRIKLKRIFNVK